MEWNSQKAEEGSLVQDGLTTQGIVVDIEVGIVDQFLGGHKELWKGDLQSPCINLVISITYDNKIFQANKIMTFKRDGDRIIYSRFSNIAKYRKTYGKLHEKLDKVNVKGVQGYWALVLN